MTGFSVNVTGVGSSVPPGVSPGWPGLSPPVSISSVAFVPLSESSSVYTDEGDIPCALAVLLYGPRFIPGVIVKLITILPLPAYKRLWLLSIRLTSDKPSNNGFKVKSGEVTLFT